MSFSSTALEQREKELKTLITFLTYSLIGSLTLHIGLLASGIGNLVTKVPLKPLPSITKESVSPKKVDTQPQEVSSSKDTAVKPLSTETTAVQPSSESSSNLSQLLAGIRDGRANPESFSSVSSFFRWWWKFRRNI